MGVGSERQRWITYRDAMTYRNVVRALYEGLIERRGGA